MSEKDVVIKIVFCKRVRAEEKTGDVSINITATWDRLNLCTRRGLCLLIKRLPTSVRICRSGTGRNCLMKIISENKIGSAAIENVKMENAGMNPKSLQYLTGRADITMTLNYYAHATYESARDEFDRIMGTARITDLPQQEAEHISV